MVLTLSATSAPMPSAGDQGDGVLAAELGRLEDVGLDGGEAAGGIVESGRRLSSGSEQALRGGHRQSELFTAM